MKTTSNILFGVFITLLMSLSLVSEVMADFELGAFKFRGYVRDYHSINLENIPETAGYDDKGDISMNRQVLYLEGFGSTGPLAWTGRVRIANKL